MSVWRPHTTGILLSGVLILVVGAAVAFIVSNMQLPTEVRVGSGVFQARIVKDEASRQRGLSGMTSLKPNEGMLFVFESNDTWGIWMKDMRFSIDIIWMDENKRVVHIVKNAPVDDRETVYRPKQAARYVLELPAGSVQTNNIKVGQLVFFVADSNEVQ